MPDAITAVPSGLPNLLAVRRVYHARHTSEDAFGIGDVGEEDHARYERRHEADVEEAHPQCRVPRAHSGDEDAEGPYRCEEGDDEEANNAGWWDDTVFVVDVD